MRKKQEILLKMANERLKQIFEGSRFGYIVSANDKSVYLITIYEKDKDISVRKERIIYRSMDKNHLLTVYKNRNVDLNKVDKDIKDMYDFYCEYEKYIQLVFRLAAA